MTTTIDPLDIRRRLGRREWTVPTEFGPDGWKYDSMAAPRRRIIITVSDTIDDARDWVHASISREDRIPDYDELVMLHAAVWPNGYAYQCFVPPSDHVNIHANALHLWGLRSGVRALPNFGWAGSI